ncbi:MAG: RNA methyltransferase [Candidatus Omnitrophica bacterium]|nr:RNA methyltransferase [Candidatus Omnitrophota bacterium]
MKKEHMFLYGKKTVLERLRANPKSIQKIFLKDNFQDEQIENLISKENVPCERLPEKKVEDMKRVKNLQGIIAKVNAFEFIAYEKLLERVKEKKVVLVFLDRINDPHNLGVIMRSLACFGGFAVVICEHGACPITDAVLHVGSGADNYVAVAKVADMPRAIISAKNSGLMIIGAVVDKAQDISSIALTFPVGLVLGAELEGISSKVEELLDIRAVIPMPGKKLSLNVAMACTVFCYEIARKRNAGSFLNKVE